LRFPIFRLCARASRRRERKRESEDPEALRRRIHDLETQQQGQAVRPIDASEIARLRTQVADLRSRPPREISLLTNDDRELLERVAARIDNDKADVDHTASSLAALLASTTTLATSLTEVREVLNRIAGSPGVQVAVAAARRSRR
jgi:hypothetical protein